MIKEITLNGGRQLKLAANAATPFRFKQIFGGDLLRMMQHTANDDQDAESVDDYISKLAFIMNRQAEQIDLNTVSESDFYEWLEGFESMDFVFAGADIINAYVSTTNTSVEPKKN